MENTIMYGLGSVGVVSLISLIGVVVLSLRESFVRKAVFVLVSLAVGALFGDAIIHLIPEALEKAENPVFISTFILLGIFAFFILEKFLRWHHPHGGEHIEEAAEATEADEDRRIKPVGVLVLVSDGIHNLIDGIIIGASYLVSIEVGIATTLAVALHEIPQEIGDFGVLLHAGLSKLRALFLNFLSALLAVGGFLLAVLLVGSGEEFVAPAVAFAAGGFLYIAGSDLVPELHRTTGAIQSLIQLAAVLIGVSLMFALLLVEV